MLASLREAAIAAGHPEWGHGGPHDSGNYNSHSSETGFFKSYGGSWDTGAQGPARHLLLLPRLFSCAASPVYTCQQSGRRSGQAVRLVTS